MTLSPTTDEVRKYYAELFPYDSIDRLYLKRSASHFQNANPLPGSELMLFGTAGKKRYVKRVFLPTDKTMGQCMSYVNVKTRIPYMYSLHESSTIGSFIIDLDECPIQTYVSRCETWNWMKIYANYLTKWFKLNFTELSDDDFIYYFSGNRGLHMEITHPRFVSMSPLDRQYLLRCFSEEPCYHSPMLDELIEIFKTEVLSCATRNELRHMFNLVSGLYTAPINDFKQHELYTILKRVFDDCVESHSPDNYIIINTLFKNNIWGKRDLLQFLCNLILPELDVAVTTQSKHMVRLPFSIHEKTGNVKRPFANLNVLMRCNYPQIYFTERYRIQMEINTFNELLKR